LLINAPADGDQARFGAQVVNQCKHNATRLLSRCGFELQDEESVATTPTEFHQLFPETGGALYGAATHRTLAPFSRPTAKTKVRGLYLVGGGVHPGAGLPMVTMGGRIAANEVRKDLASTSGWTPADISGGT
jgi:1-hydroxycarotenoid 3,4-desaturase